jgi:hypothetical protein
LGDEAPQAGLQEMEASLKRSFQQMQQGIAPVGSSRLCSSQLFSDAALMAAYHAPWMDPARERELPRQRAVAAAAVVTAQRQQQLQQQQQIRSPVYNDLQDPITQHMGVVDASQYNWVAAYKRASHKQLPRQLREFGWRLLHAGVKVGARRMVVAGRQAPDPAQFTCPAQQCQQQPQLETFTHLFVECPVAAAVWQWFVQLWQQVQPGVVVPISSSVLLLDDSSVWSPPVDKQLLWTHLRLLLLESIWAVRSSCCSNGHVSSSAAGDGGNHGTGNSSSAAAVVAARVQGGSSADDQGQAANAPGISSFNAKAVACRFRAELQQQVLREWDRVEVDIRVGSGIPLSWLGGRSPVISRDDFKRKWAGLYRVTREGADRRMVLAVSTAGL